jgi:hypothetical protein
MWRGNEAVSRPSVALLALAMLSCTGCEQLGNPEQYTTGPTSWKDGNGHLITTTRSFKNEKTIRRITSEGLDDFDYRDASIGPSEALTIVLVRPRTLRMTRRRTLKLTTIFKLEDRPPITRTWAVPASSDRWRAAFSLPEPPIGAVSSVGP